MESIWRGLNLSFCSKILQLSKAALNPEREQLNTQNNKDELLILTPETAKKTII